MNRILALAIAAVAAEAYTPPDALHRAAKSADEAAVLALINEGADVNGRAWANSTALHVAAGKAELPILQLLLENGADPTITNDFLATPLHSAALSRLPTALHCIGELLTAGAPINAQDDGRMTALLLVAAYGRSKFSHLTARMLIRKGADVSIVDSSGMTALHFAAKHADLPVVQVLVKEGRADVNAVDSRGRTPLHLAGNYISQMSNKLIYHVNSNQY